MNDDVPDPYAAALDVLRAAEAARDPSIAFAKRHASERLRDLSVEYEATPRRTAQLDTNDCQPPNSYEAGLRVLRARDPRSLR